jgi:hypothetical protein
VVDCVLGPAVPQWQRLGRAEMQVNVFVIQVEQAVHTELLVLPLSREVVIPPQFQRGWKYYATVDSSDSLFRGIDARAIEIEIESTGFAVVKPMLSDRG